MEGVEDIPGSCLAEGIAWREPGTTTAGTWETFPEYMSVLEETPRIMDIGCQLPHGALRFYVMGDRGADHEEVPTPDECAQMKALTTEALNAGAKTRPFESHFVFVLLKTAISPRQARDKHMKRLRKQAFCAGALGFTTARTVKHMAADGRVTPGAGLRETPFIQSYV